MVKLHVFTKKWPQLGESATCKILKQVFFTFLKIDQVLHSQIGATLQQQKKTDPVLVVIIVEWMNNTLKNIFLYHQNTYFFFKSLFQELYVLYKHKHHHWDETDMVCLTLWLICSPSNKLPSHSTAKTRHCRALQILVFKKCTCQNGVFKYMYTNTGTQLTPHSSQHWNIHCSMILYIFYIVLHLEVG